MPGVTADRACPKCSGKMWDNTASKKNAKAPDYVCKDRDNCDGAVWLKKDEKKAPAAAAEPKAVVPLETLTAEYGTLLRSIATKLNEMAPGLNEKLRPTFADAQAAAATIYIQFRKQS